ncbi:MAG: DsrE family protein [Actinobacteria bacterium]|nr:DsrE family protein [Actinomycetota bacterium]
MLSDTVVLITRDGFGTTSAGDAAFGEEMLEKFLHTLEGREDKPAAICAYTEGALVVTDDSPVLLSLQMLEAAGVEIIACGTCLDHYGRTDRVAVGRIGAMTDIVEKMAAAAKVITV